MKMYGKFGRKTTCGCCDYYDDDSCRAYEVSQPRRARRRRVYTDFNHGFIVDGMWHCCTWKRKLDDIEDGDDYEIMAPCVIVDRNEGIIRNLEEFTDMEGNPL